MIESGSGMGGIEKKKLGSRQWSVVRIHEMVIQSGRTEEIAFKEAQRVSGHSWAGIKHGSSSVGPMPVSLGAFLYQVEGARLMACIDAMECLSKMPDVPKEVTPDISPDLVKVPGTSTRNCFDLIRSS